MALAVAAGVAVLAGLIAVTALPGCASASKKKDFNPAGELERAQKLIARGKYFKARLVLQEALETGVADKEVTSEMQITLADAYFHDGGTINLAEALARYTNFLAFNPLHARADYVQYQLAMCHFLQVYAPDKDQAQTRKALEEFRKTAALYPASAYAGEAEARIREGRRLLAEHEIVVGRFYAGRKAFKAAIERYKDVLDKYPRYEDKPGIYFDLAKALDRLGRTEEARAYLKLLVESYPEHEVNKSARSLLRKINRRSPLPEGIAEAIGD
ncbi:MAG: outer membrane protein assembly factor BamD [Acidobacteriota bacterium]